MEAVISLGSADCLLCLNSASHAEGGCQGAIMFQVLSSNYCYEVITQDSVSVAQPFKFHVIGGKNVLGKLQSNLDLTVRTPGGFYLALDEKWDEKGFS